MKSRSFSKAEMEERVARFAGMKPNKVAFVDTRLPGHERDIFNMIGYGVNYRSGTPIHASGEREGMEQPRTFWIPSIGASGLIVYDGDAFPEWRGDIFAGGLAATHRRLSRITVDDDGRVMTQESLLHGVYRIREVRQGPDGFIYLATDNRAGGLTDIVRMEPATPATY